MTTRVAVTVEPPQQVQVGPFTYRIEWVDELPGKFGETNTTLLRIRIDAQAPLQQQQDTLVHEILHAIHWGSGSLDAWKTTDDIDELVCSTTSSLLWQVIRDHPDICDWLRT